MSPHCDDEIRANPPRVRPNTIASFGAADLAPKFYPLVSSLLACGLPCRARMKGEGELGRCLPSNSGVRARTVVIRPPTPKGNASLGQRGEQCSFRSSSRRRPLKLSIVLHRLARRDVVPRDTARGKEKSALLVYAERRSRYVIANALPRATADVVQRETGHMLHRYPVHTITDDNGSEFALHRLIEQRTNALMYFARAGHPEERGTCENTIGLIREFFPKGTSLAHVTQLHATLAAADLNRRPRKRFSYEAPRRIFAAITELSKYLIR